MKIVVSGIHLKKFPQSEKYAIKRTQKLEKFHSKIKLLEIRLISEKAHRGQEKDYYCEIEAFLPGHNILVVDTEREMDKAIDKAVERMSQALRRAKEKDISKKHKEGIKLKEKNKFTKLAP